MASNISLNTTGGACIQDMLSLQSFLDQIPKSIELLPQIHLPSSASPFVFMEGHLGVSQECLLGLYGEACKMLKTVPSSAEDAQMLVACTSSVILANPAHQHCLNLRKELMKRKDSCIRPQQELSFLEATMSVSKTFSKQSALWSHRRWVLNYLFPPDIVSPQEGSSRGSSSLAQSGSFEVSDLSKVPLAVTEKEIQLVFKASDLYPRNYYAWMHAQFCLEVIFAHLQCGRARNEAQELLRSHIEVTKRWIERHVSDYSAVHHLCSISARLASDAVFAFDIPELEDIPEHALSLLERYPSHESLWMYLRISVASVPDVARRNQRIEAVGRHPQFHGREAAVCAAWWELKGDSYKKTDKGMEYLRMNLRYTQNS